MDSTTIAALAEIQEMTETSLLPPTKSKKRRVAPASDADLRRKEANRLAAERSRGRQQEKFIALETAAQVLGDENLRLKDEISKLERASGTTSGQFGDISSQPQDSSSFAIDSDLSEQNTAQAQQDSHSRTILAALMSGGIHVDEAFTNSGMDLDVSGSWMEGMESIMKETDMSGRLGELAAIAAGRGQPGDATAVRRSGNDVVLHQEMEKMLKEDIAGTKAALARMDHRLLVLRTGGTDDVTQDATSLFATLDIPPAIVSKNTSELSNTCQTIQKQIEDTKLQIGVLREVVIRMRDAKDVEHEKLKAVVGEVQALGMDGGDKERERVGTVLKALRNYVGYLLGGPNHDSTLATSAFVAPFQSPATARRRRGRPPKNESPSYPYVDHPSIPNADGSTPSPIAHKRNTRGKSRLQQSFTQAEALTHQELDQAHQEHLHHQTMDVATEADHDFLSHLAAQHGSPRGLESSSFTDFLPAAAAAESLSQTLKSNSAHTRTQKQIGVDKNDDHLDLEGGGGLDERDELDLGDDMMDGVEVVEGVEGIPNVLSRLRKGVPGSCDICGRTETTVWRKLVLGEEDLKVCNPCGLYHAKFGVIRPPELWGDGKSVKKRRAALRVSGIQLSSHGLRFGAGHPESTGEGSTSGSRFLEVGGGASGVQGVGDGDGEGGEGEGVGENGDVDFGEGEFEGLVNDLDKGQDMGTFY